jgi:hypothetical protein
MEGYSVEKSFIMKHFSLIALSLGLLFIGSATIDIGLKRNPKDEKDQLNTYYGLNITGIVFICINIISTYIMPMK